MAYKDMQVIIDAIGETVEITDRIVPSITSRLRKRSIKLTPGLKLSVGVQKQ